MAQSDRVFPETRDEARELNRRLARVDGVQDLARAIAGQNELLAELVRSQRESVTVLH